MKHHHIIYLLSVLNSFMLMSCNAKDAPEVSANHTYDIWVNISGSTSNTATGDPHMVKKIPTLLEGEYDYEGTGVETKSSEITPYALYHKGYYYSLNRAQQFGKYKITDEGITVVNRFEYTDIQSTKFAHTFLDDHTILIAGSPGSKKEVNWAKIDVNKMEIIANGTLDLPQLPQNTQFNSGGILAYRKQDNKLFFCFRHDEADKPAMAVDKNRYFFIAAIDPNSMKILNVAKEERVCETASVAYGNTRQQNTFFDESGNLFIACNSPVKGAKTSTKKYGAIIKIKSGEYAPDPTYLVELVAPDNSKSKVMTMHKIKGNKAILYLQNPQFATGTNEWSTKKQPFVFYWAVVDLTTKELHKIKDIPFSQGGNFTQLITTEKEYAILGISDKIQTMFYRYDYNNEHVTEVAKFKEGFFADRIVVLDPMDRK